MGQARDEAGNIWETDAQGNAVRLVTHAQSPLQDPRLGSQVQVAQGQAAAAPYEAPTAAANLARTQQQVAAQPLQNESTRVGIEQNRQSMQNQRFNQNQGLRQEWNALPISKNFQTILQKGGQALNAKAGPQGDLAILYAFATVMDPDSVVRESEQEMAKSTATRFAALRQKFNMNSADATLPAGVRPGLLEQIRANTKVAAQFYGQERGFYADLAKRNGFDPAEIVGPNPIDAYNRMEAAYIKANGGTPKTLATGTYHSENDPEAADKLRKLIIGGAPYGQAVKLAQSGGFTASLPDPQSYAAAAAAAKKGQSFTVEAIRNVPSTSFQQFAASPMGAGISGAAKATSLGFGDELAASVMPGDYTANRDAFAAGQNDLAAQHPYADLAGQAAGGALSGMGIAKGVSAVPGIEGALFGARTPFPSLLSREALAGDTLYGAGYGAGSENDNRLQGAGYGALIGAGGGVAARGTLHGAASAISPTGGAMRPLYDMGVRPSVGQRLGGVPNTIEEKLQSVPFVGDAIKGTRDRARDQFQIGLFNDALGQIGKELPAGIRPGHAPHAFAQDAISGAYDNALTSMNATADPQFGHDLGALQMKVGGLKGESQTQFNTVWNGSIGRRFKMGSGQISGAAYKDAESELGKKVAAIRSNPNGDHELASALEDALGALRSSALRNSPPEAVHALNAADAAHARIVRLEDASRRAGEPAEFSPTQYNTAVKNMSGGVRNRNYLRGDALNTDLAAIGTRLGDKVSNSGSIDRLLATMAVGGAGYVNPTAAAGLGALGALNAPGVRNAVTELMAPRGAPIFDKAADALRKRARLAGMFGAPLALDYYGQ